MVKKVEGRPDLVKDENTGVFSYINSAKKKQARAERLRQLENEQETKKDVENLKQDVGEIKDMLKALLEKL